MSNNARVIFLRDEPADSANIKLPDRRVTGTALQRLERPPCQVRVRLLGLRHPAEAPGGLHLALGPGAAASGG